MAALYTPPQVGAVYKYHKTLDNITSLCYNGSIATRRGDEQMATAAERQKKYRDHIRQRLIEADKLKEKEKTRLEAKERRRERDLHRYYHKVPLERLGSNDV